MTTEHEPSCDGLHTARQPCNDGLDGMPAPPGAAVIETPSANGARGHDDAAEADERSAISRPAVATRITPAEMPAPSPEALRAWEETAAAVGATATPAPPAKAIFEGEIARRPGWFAGHAGLVMLAAIAAFVLLVVARRRS